MAQLILTFDLKTLTNESGVAIKTPSGATQEVPVLIDTTFTPGPTNSEAFCKPGGWANPNDSNKALYPTNRGSSLSPDDWGGLGLRNDLLDCEQCDEPLP